MTRLVPPVPFFAALLAATAASALTPPLPECPNGIPHDMGGGLVSTLQYAYDSQGSYVSGTQLVTHCASGRSLLVQLPLRDTHESAEFARHLLRDAAESSEVLTLEDLRARLEQFVGPTIVDQSLPDWRETCGCATLYPGLRGDKFPWEG